MNSSAWDKFRRQQATEREQLQRLLSGLHPLLSKCRDKAPTEIELAALAATLHSFYTGVENIFKRVSVELDGDPVRGDNWHRDLLLRMKTRRRNARRCSRRNFTMRCWIISASATFSATPTPSIWTGEKCHPWFSNWKKPTGNWNTRWTPS